MPAAPGNTDPFVGESAGRHLVGLSDISLMLIEGASPERVAYGFPSLFDEGLPEEFRATVAPVDVPPLFDGSLELD